LSPKTTVRAWAMLIKRTEWLSVIQLALEYQVNNNFLFHLDLTTLNSYVTEIHYRVEKNPVSYS
jgi:hypothetical protein